MSNSDKQVEVLELAVWVKYPNDHFKIQTVFYCSEQEPTLEALKNLKWWGTGEPVHFIVQCTLAEHYAKRREQYKRDK